MKSGSGHGRVQGFRSGSGEVCFTPDPLRQPGRRAGALSIDLRPTPLTESIDIDGIRLTVNARTFTKESDPVVPGGVFRGPVGLVDTSITGRPYNESGGVILCLAAFGL